MIPLKPYTNRIYWAAKSFQYASNVDAWTIAKLIHGMRYAVFSLSRIFSRHDPKIQFSSGQGMDPYDSPIQSPGILKFFMFLLFIPLPSVACPGVRDRPADHSAGPSLSLTVRFQEGKDKSGLGGT